MEAVNESQKLIAIAIDCLKAELEPNKPDTWTSEGNLKETIDFLEQALDKLTKQSST